MFRLSRPATSICRIYVASFRVPPVSKIQFAALRYRLLVLTGAVVAVLIALVGNQPRPEIVAAAGEETLQPGTAPAEASVQFCNTSLISITGSLGMGPATPYPASIQVSGVTGVVTNVSVTLNNLQHNWGRDIDVLLVGPNGEKFVIMSDVGQSQGFDNPATITVSDQGATRFTNQEVPFPSGTYKPTNYNDACVSCVDSFPSPAPPAPWSQPGPNPSGSATFASVFNQANPNGTWSLYIVDDSSSNEGSVAGGWCLNITTSAPAPNNLQFAATNFNGDANSTAAATVNRVNGAPGAVSVNYATSNGSATGGASCAAGVDYVTTNGTLNFADGETSKTFPVQLCPDSGIEPNETINLILSNPTGGAFIGIPGTATLTIIPAGTPAVQFCNPNQIVIPVSTVEGRAVPYPASLTVSGVTGVINSVKLTLSSIQHSWGSDIDILLVSPSGRRFVVMSDIGEQHGFDNATTLTLTDAATNDLFNVGIPIPSGVYRPGNLFADDNFPSPAAAPWSQPFFAGRSTFANVFNNTTPNGVWSLYVVDDGASAGGTIGGWCVDITAGAPVSDAIQFDLPNFNRASLTTAAITVLRPNTTVGAVSVNYATSNGTANGGASCDDSGVDYVSTNGTLNFADGEPSKIINVQLCGGDASEPSETLNLNLSNPTGGAVIGSPGAATVTIYNGDLPCNINWTAASSPHVVSGLRSVFPEEVLCVEAGATVRFTGNGKINLYGTMRTNGTAAAHVNLDAVGSLNRIEVAGKLDLRQTDVGVFLNVNLGGTLVVRESNFRARGGIGNFSGIVFEGKNNLVSLENVIFDSNETTQSSNAQLYGNFSYLILKNVTFRNRAFFNAGGFGNKFENVVSENGAYEGLSFNNYGSQPTLLENLSVTNCARAGLALTGGNFFIGSNVTIQNCEYPLTGQGGILPGSVVPTTGNRNNWFEVGQPGGTITYAPIGIPYVVSGFANIGNIEFLPGVTIKARPNFAFNTGGGSPLDALGLPNAPVVFEPFDAAQKWDGGQFNSSGDRLEYVVLDGMGRGIASPELSGSHYYVDNSIIRNNTVGVRDMLNGNGSAYLQSNLFTNNETAIVAENAGIQGQQRTNPNLFENNSVAVSSSSVPDVRYSWWNSPTGPTTTGNPGGTGDRINGGARFKPFLTSRPDTTDHPPVVRLPRVPYRQLYGAYQGLLDAGKKIILHWDASDDRRIVKQKILFSPSGNTRKNFTLIADNLPPTQRSFELTVPSVGFVQGSSVQFFRIVAVDDKGQEGFEDWQPVIPSGEIYGDLTITADVAGRTFEPGDQIPFTFQINQGFPTGSVERFIIFDADRKLRSYGANTIATMPPFSTDTARLMIVYTRSLNQQKFFFSEPFSIRYDRRFPDAPPTVSLNSPTAGQQFNAGDAIPIEWTAADDEAIRHFNIQTSTDGGRTWIQIAENLPPTTTNYTWQPEIRSAISDVRVRVVAVDRRFQNSSATRTVRFNASANQPPTVQVTFPANGAVYTVGQSTFIAADASDPDGTIQRVEFYAKGSAFLPEGDSHFIGSDTTPPYQVPWIYPSAQGYILTARAYDVHNRLVNSSPVNVTFNPFDPAPLPIARPELTNPVDGATFPAGSNITLEGLPAPTTRTIVRLEFYNGTTLVGTDTTAPYSLTLNNVPAGRYTFFVRSVADNNAESISPVTDVTVGGAAARRTPFDFDGDGKADVSIFRPTNGEWWMQNSSGTVSALQFGNGADKIVPSDYTGDGKADVAIFRPSEGSWYILRSEDNSFFAFPFGSSGDLPQPADYDADGKADAAVFRPSSSTWFIQKSGGGTDIIGFGSEGDIPTPADYDGDGKADIAIFRLQFGQWWIRRSSDGTARILQFGASDDQVAHADFTGDGKVDVAFWRPSNGYWYVLRSEDLSFYAFPFGISGDLPVPADYDGDGRADAAVFRNGTWYLQQSSMGSSIVQFGLADDKPIPSAFLR